MKEWCAHLDQELATWPSVVRRPMFGMFAFYRGDRIFAVIPRTKSFEPPNTIGFKLYSPPPDIKGDPRIVTDTLKARGWILFRLEDSRDLNGAVQWLEIAYRGCTSKKKISK